MATLPCPGCHGDGYFIHTGGPGYFDRSFGNYLPSETEVPCESCDGFGEVEGCDTCDSTAHLCICTEDERYQAATEASL